MRFRTKVLSRSAHCPEYWLESFQRSTYSSKTLFQMKITNADKYEKVAFAAKVKMESGDQAGAEKLIKAMEDYNAANKPKEKPVVKLSNKRRIDPAFPCSQANGFTVDQFPGLSKQMYITTAMAQAIVIGAAMNSKEVAPDDVAMKAQDLAKALLGLDPASE